MKKYLIAGLIILVPAMLSILLIVFLFDFFTTPFMPIIESFLFKIFPFIKSEIAFDVLSRVVVVIILCVIITLLGVVARLFFFDTLINIANGIFSKIPFVKSVYKLIKDVTTSFASHERKAFTKTTMINFPSKDSYAIGFESGEVPKEIQDKVNKKLKPVFIPASPHPISSFLVLAPIEDLNNIDIKNEDAVKFIVSCGLVLPGEKLEDVLKK